MKKKSEYLGLLSAFLLFCGLVTWVRSATVRDTYRFVQQEKELGRLQDALQEAKVRWSRASSPRRLQAVAAQIGLNPPRLDQRIRLQRQVR